MSTFAATVLLAAPFLGVGGAALGEPIVVGGPEPLLVWSGTSIRSPFEVEVHAQRIASDGSVGRPARLTRSGRDGDAQTAAVAPAILRRAGGRLLLAYSERRSRGGRLLRTIRVRAVDADGTRGGPGREVGEAVRLRGAFAGSDAPPALAWGPGRRWAAVTWAEMTPSGARVVLQRVRPGGQPLGPTVVLDREDGRRAAAWTTMVPTAASSAAGPVIAWTSGIGRVDARLRAARVRREGAPRDHQLRIDARQQRRLLGARRGAVSQAWPSLVQRPDRTLALAWTAAGPEDPELLGVPDAVLTTALPGPRPVHRVSDVNAEFIDTRVVPRLVNAPDGGAAVSWLNQDEGISRSCCGAAGFVRRLDARLAPRGPIEPLTTSADPSRAPEYDEANGVDRPAVPGVPAIGYAGTTLLAAWALDPYIVGRAELSAAARTRGAR